MVKLTIKEGQQAIIEDIGGTKDYQLFLLSLGLIKGTVFTFNYSPQFTKLVNISLGGKMIALRTKEFALISYKIIDHA